MVNSIGLIGSFGGIGNFDYSFSSASNNNSYSFPDTGTISSYLGHSLNVADYATKIGAGVNGIRADAILIRDEHGIGKPEPFDTRGNLFDLLLAVCSGVVGIGAQACDGAYLDVLSKYCGRHVWGDLSFESLTPKQRPQQNPETQS